MYQRAYKPGNFEVHTHGKYHLSKGKKSTAPTIDVGHLRTAGKGVREPVGSVADGHAVLCGCWPSQRLQAIPRVRFAATQLRKPRRSSAHTDGVHFMRATRGISEGRTANLRQWATIAVGHNVPSGCRPSQRLQAAPRMPYAATHLLGHDDPSGCRLSQRLQAAPRVTFVATHLPKQWRSSLHLAEDLPLILSVRDTCVFIPPASRVFPLRCIVTRRSCACLAPPP
eukprot:gene23055-biopygen4285